MDYQYLTVESVRVSLQDVFLSELTEEDDEIAKSAEIECIEQMKSYLTGRYDVAALFDGEAEKRPLVLKHLKNLWLYTLYGRISPRKMADSVKENYHETLDWLEGVAKGRYSPNWPVIQDPDIPTNDPMIGDGVRMKGHYY